MDNVNVNNTRKTICLSMIVKNESHVIERCLTSVFKHIDYWVISDTGSTDNTKEKIQDFFDKKGIPGTLLVNEWKNFSYNRNIVLNVAKDKADYILIIDADEELIQDGESKVFEKLDKDFYYIKSLFGKFEYDRVQLVSTQFHWQYDGVIHEYLHSDNAKDYSKLKGFYNLPRAEGARSRDPNKYKKDALIFEMALLDEPNNVRNWFYLAQSYKDAGMYDKASEVYLKRAQMGGYQEELYIALYEHALTKILTTQNSTSVLGDFMNAHAYRPERLEALFFLVNHYYQNKKYKFAYNLGKPSIHIKNTTDKLYIQYKIYKYKFRLIMGICAYHIQNYNDCLTWFNDIKEEVNLMEDIEKALFQKYFILAQQKNNYILKKYGINNPLIFKDNIEDKKMGVIISVPEKNHILYVNNFLKIFNEYKKISNKKFKLYFVVLNDEVYNLEKTSQATPGLIYNYFFNKYQQEFDYVCFMDYQFKPLNCEFNYHDEVSLCHQILSIDDKEINDTTIMNGAIIMSNEKFKSINGFQNNSLNYVNDIPFLLSRCNDLNIGWKRRQSKYEISIKDYTIIKKYTSQKKVYSLKTNSLYDGLNKINKYIITENIEVNKDDLVISKIDFEVKQPNNYNIIQFQNGISKIYTSQYLALLKSDDFDIEYLLKLLLKNYDYFSGYNIFCTDKLNEVNNDNIQRFISYMKKNNYDIAGVSSADMGGIPVVFKLDFFVCNFKNINEKCIGRGYSYWNIQDKVKYLEKIPIKLREKYQNCYAFGEELFGKKETRLIKQEQDEFFCNSNRYCNSIYLSQNTEGEIYLDRELYPYEGEDMLLGKL
jgi:hypothetical protein